MDLQLVELPSVTENGNKVKNLVIQQLHKDGVITQEQWEEYTTSWNIILIKPSWFQRWKSKYFPNSNDYMYQYVKF